MWFSSADEEFYCADVCDPSPCTGDDTCSLVDRDDCDTDASPCPPVATCTASLVAADEEAETDEEAQVIVDLRADLNPHTTQSGTILITSV